MPLINKKSKLVIPLRKQSKADKKRDDVRDLIWPGSANWIWDFRDREKVVGFATVPRLLPWILHLIATLAKNIGNGDPSKAYLDLWCRDFGQGIIQIQDESQCAFAAGYTSNRALRTWHEHMFKLVELGFILTERTGNREFGTVLLLNPLAISAWIHTENKDPEGWWSSFLGRASEIGANIPDPLNPKKLKTPQPVV